MTWSYLEQALSSNNSQSTAGNFANNPALLATGKASLFCRIFSLGLAIRFGCY
jgi:hypothetical protein